MKSEMQRGTGMEEKLNFIAVNYSGRVVAEVGMFCGSQSWKLANWCNSILSTLIDSRNLLLVSLDCIMMSSQMYSFMSPLCDHICIISSTDN